MDILPDDKITSETFWTTPEDATLALNGVYNVLRNDYVYGYGGGGGGGGPAPLRGRGGGGGMDTR
ncbi:MAG: hypothetical protein LUH63_16550 [Parabacteroides sp.]|nr:hypothetical protein [Parabacteroides sp.]